MDRIRQALSAELAKLKALGPRAGAAYIWQYYRLWIIGIVFLAGFGGFLLARFLTTPATVSFYLTLANTRQDAGNGSALWNGYVSYAALDLREGQVVFNSDAYFDYARDQGRGNTYYSLFTGLVDAGVLDAVTMGPEALEALGATGRLLDLNRDGCEALRQAYADRLLYAQPLNAEYSETPVPIGIDVSDSILVTKYHLYTDGCALGLGANTGRIEAVEAFLDYIFEA